MNAVPPPPEQDTSGQDGAKWLANVVLASGLVILNGVVAGLIAIGMFGMLVMLLKATIAAT